MNSLNFPLYHATSSLFENSIKEHGLGGYKPIKHLKVLELLNELEVIADNSLEDVDDWKYELKYPVSLILKQIIVSGGNWQHGEVYLTPDPFTARRYSNNKYGSEIISETFKLIKLLRKNNISIEPEIFKIYQDFFALELIESIPIIFRIIDLPLNYLSQGEMGEDLE